MKTVRITAYESKRIRLEEAELPENNIGEQVAVIGFGPVGNLATQFAGSAGAGKVTGFDIVGHRECLRKMRNRSNRDHLYIKYLLHSVLHSCATVKG